MKRKNRQFGEQLSPGQPFRVSIILRQADRVAKNKKRKGRTQTQAKRRKQKNKSGQDRGKHFLIKGKSSKKRDGRRKMQGKSRKSDRGRGVSRKKTKKRNGRKVKVRKRKEQEKSKGNKDQDKNRRRRRTRRIMLSGSQIRSPKRGRKQQSRRRQSRGRKNEDRSEDTQQHCTGALIKENWIITAANCFDVSQTFFTQLKICLQRDFIVHSCLILVLLSSGL